MTLRSLLHLYLSTTLTVLHTMKLWFTLAAPFDFVKNLVSQAASHRQPQPLAPQDACFLVNVYSYVYGIPAVSVGQLSPDAPDLFNNVSRIFLQPHWAKQFGTASH